MSFGQELAAAEEAVDALPKQEPSEKEAKKSADEESRLERLVRISPRGAIVEAYGEIEAAIRELAGAAGLAKDHSVRPTYYVLKQLRQSGMIDEQTATALDDLRRIMNRASRHISRPDEEEALRYIGLALSLSTQLFITARAASMPPPGPIPPGQP